MDPQTEVGFNEKRGGERRGRGLRSGRVERERGRYGGEDGRSVCSGHAGRPNGEASGAPSASEDPRRLRLRCSFSRKDSLTVSVGFVIFISECRRRVSGFRGLLEFGD